MPCRLAGAAKLAADAFKGQGGDFGGGGATGEWNFPSISLPDLPDITLPDIGLDL
jgi:hypothetical protein